MYGGAVAMMPPPMNHGQMHYPQMHNNSFGMPQLPNLQAQNDSGTHQLPNLQGKNDSGTHQFANNNGRNSAPPAMSSQRSSNYTLAETMNLLDIMEDLLPIGQQSWELVHVRHSHSYPGRNVDSLRRKFNKLWKHRTPTGKVATWMSLFRRLLPVDFVLFLMLVPVLPSALAGEDQREPIQPIPLATHLRVFCNKIWHYELKREERWRSRSNVASGDVNVASGAMRSVRVDESASMSRR